MTQIAGTWRPQVPQARYIRRGKPTVYAGFWQRLGGALLDQAFLMAVTLPVQFGIGLAFGFLAESATTCVTKGRGAYAYKVCDRPIGFVVLGGVVASIIGWYLWWRLIVRRQAVDAQTIGMQSVNVEVRRARDLMFISTAQAFLRSLLGGLMSFFLLVPAALVVLLAAELPEHPWEHLDLVRWQLSWPMLGLVFFLLTLPALPWLWSLVDRRRQTLYDKLTGTVVVRVDV